MNDNKNKLHADSQCSMILADLQRGNGITSLVAVHKYGCLRLSERIRELERRGVVISRKWIVTPKTHKRVVEYRLQEY